ncbi:RILP-like protein 2 isoform X2 [Cyprinus carpio]|uniref:RILP-like protein 2 n=1 Tax=Cyprinus carpio TaxID=7962 RepID=A0A9R0AT93_CYPCA|nr:RILP-like protein 2 isoform X2 [Cyprinus carpio]
MQAFDKDVLDMTCEDVYDISYVIGRDLLKVNTGSREFSDLQFKIVRVLEMFETMVNKYNLSVEELRMELENMKRETERVVAEGSSGAVNTTAGPNQLVVDLKDPNRPRFTMQELKEVLQERNKLKAQLLVAQEELQLYKSQIERLLCLQWGPGIRAEDGGSEPGDPSSVRSRTLQRYRGEQREEHHSETILVSTKIVARIWLKLKHI